MKSATSRRPSLRFLELLAFLALTGPAAAVSPVGSELPLSTFTAGLQVDPDVAVAANSGDFAVVWESNGQRAGHADTYLRRFRKDGVPLGAEALVSDSVSTEVKHLSRVAAAPTGELAVVWQAEEGAPGSGKVYGRFYDAGGSPATGVLELATDGENPAVASDGAGRFVIVWSDFRRGMILGRRFLADGKPIAEVFTVGAAGGYPDVAADAAGGFVVVWHQFVNPSYLIRGRRFDASQSPLGAEFPVNLTTAFAHTTPRIGMAPGGAFVVAWNRQEESFGNPNAVARRFDRNAVHLGPEFPVGTAATRDQWNPDVAVDARGAFDVVWQAFGPDGESTDVYGQRFNAFGVRQGGIFEASRFPGVQQGQSAVASAPGGAFVSVWQSVDQDGDGFGVFGRRFRPSAATIDFGGNGATDAAVFRPSEGRWLADFDFQPTAELNVVYGRSGDIPVPADYDGDGITDLAVFRPASATWFIDTNRNGGTDARVVYGRSDDIPVPADYDGDGRADIAVYRPSTHTWFVDTDFDGGTDIQAALGVAAAIPVPADYDGDGAADFAVFDRGNWLVQKGMNAVTVPYGRGGDVPIPGDYDGDAIADFAVFRPQGAAWFVDTNQNGGTDIRVPYGQSTDVPVPGDFDGDGVTDFAVFRPASGKWFVDTNRNGGTDLSVVFGRAGDVPLRERGWTVGAATASP